MRGDPPTMSTALQAIPESTPHARGSTVSRFISLPNASVYPACAGIHRTLSLVILDSFGLPRMRGDPPLENPYNLEDNESTPHARGSTPRTGGTQNRGNVYPACAGIHPLVFTEFFILVGLPRMRGDPPHLYCQGAPHTLSTPHARGSTPKSLPLPLPSKVYPACAGIHPTRNGSKKNMGSLPRMRGDPPCSMCGKEIYEQSTPHARGSTREALLLPHPYTVYPACAGIHPWCCTLSSASCCLPRMRGDPPAYASDDVLHFMSTPHARGSTL